MSKEKTSYTPSAKPFMRYKGFYVGIFINRMFIKDGIIKHRGINGKYSVSKQAPTTELLKQEYKYLGELAISTREAEYNVIDDDIFFGSLSDCKAYIDIVS